MTDDIRFHERLLRLGDWIDGDPNIDEDLWLIPRQALDEIKRLRARVSQLEQLGDDLDRVAFHETQGQCIGHRAWKPVKAWREALCDYDMLHRLREQTIVDQHTIQRLTDENAALRDVVDALVKSRDEWKAVASLFGAAFRMDEWGQYPPSNGDDVHAATRAYERLKTKEARRG